MRFSFVLALVLAPVSAFAQVAISQLPSATTPLAGTEIVPVVQGGVTKNVTVANIQNSGTQAANTVLAAPNGSAGAPTFRALLPADLGSQTANTVLAAPNGSAGTPLFRALVASDMPTLTTAATTALGTSGATIPLLNGANTWSGAQTYSVAIQAPGVTLPSGSVAGAQQSCINALLYGADPSGASDNSAALTNALAAGTGNQRCVYFPAGKYKFTSAQSIALPSGATTVASYRIVGDGSDVSMLDFASGTSGLAFTLNSPYESVHLDNLSILGGAWAAGTKGIAITQTATVSNPAYSAPNDFTNVVVRGDDGYAQSNGFGTGVALAEVSNANVIGGYVSGPTGTNLASTVCYSLIGNSTAIGVVYNFSGATANSCNIGIYYQAYIQGVTVSQSNFTGDNYGIVTPASASGMSQLFVAGSQFNTYAGALNLQTSPDSVSIIGNDFYVNTTIGSSTGINFAASQTYNVIGNDFIGLGSGTSTGVGLLSTANFGGVISGNTFRNMTQGVAFLSGTSGALVGVNSYSSVTTPITNAGSNSVAATCAAGSPTSSFSVTNGIVTHC